MHSHWRFVVLVLTWFLRVHHCSHPQHDGSNNVITQLHLEHTVPHRHQGTHGDKLVKSASIMMTRDDPELLAVRQHIVNDFRYVVKYMYNRTQCLNDLKKTPLTSWSSKYIDQTKEPTFICQYPLTEEGLGNRIGEYFEAMACSSLHGMHFINTYNLPPMPNITMDALNHSTASNSFFYHFPMVMKNIDPSIPSMNINREGLYEGFMSKCPKLTTYPHEGKGAWVERIDLIANTLTDIVDKTFPNIMTKQYIPRLTFDNITFGSRYIPRASHLDETKLPLIPDAVILFRCKDILVSFPTHPYGFLRFDIYKKLIPRNVSTIYVLSEPLDYRQKRYSDNFSINTCVRLGHDLIGYLANSFPRALITLRRGYPFESFAMMSVASTVICAPSTFCFWPAFMNNNHHFVGTKKSHRRVYIAPGRLFQYQPFISNSFHWLVKPLVLRLVTRDEVKTIKYEDIWKKLARPVTRDDIVFANEFKQAQLN